MAKETEQNSESSHESFGLNSKQLAALIQSGYTLYAQGRIQDAKTVFEGLAVLNDKNAYIHGILGAIFQKQGNLDAAIEHYSIALEVFPSDVNSLSNRGEVHLKLGKFREAAVDLKRAIELDSSNQNPAANRARALAKLTFDALDLVNSKKVED